MQQRLSQAIVEASMVVANIFTDAAKIVRQIAATDSDADDGKWKVQQAV